MIIIAGSCVLPSSTSQQPILLPTLNDTPNVGVITLPMVDHTRVAPFTNFTEHREVMVSLFYPAEQRASELFHDQQSRRRPNDHTLPYKPPATAAFYDFMFAPYGLPNGSFERLSNKCQMHAPISKQNTQDPLLIFSHGGGASRLFYTTLSEELARLGYIVAAIDHTYDALVVEFPDGTVVKGGFEKIDRNVRELLVKTRAQDVSFVVDELSQSSSSHPFELNTTDVIALGHSLGGATAAEAALNDTRIKGGINLDGRLFGSLEKPNNTLSKPFLQFQSEQSVFGTPWNWDEDWQHLAGWKLQLLLEGAQHATFSDLPLVIESLGLREKWGRGGEKLLGIVGGLRGLEIMVAYVHAFVDFVMSGKNETLLDGDDKRQFPEVKFV